MLLFLALAQTASTPHGVDVSNYSGLVTYSQWVAAKNPNVWKWKDGSSGILYAITSGYQGNGELNLFAGEQMAGARAAGILTAGYCLISNERPGDAQVKDALAIFGEEKKHLSYFFIDVEDPLIDKPDRKIRPEFIESAIKEVEREGVRPAIYTSRRIWKLTPWMDKNPYSKVPLWDADYDDNDNLLASRTHSFVPYAGWETRFAKQYNDESHGDGLKFVNTTKIIGADVNVFATEKSVRNPQPEIVPCMYVVDTYTYAKDQARRGPNVIGGNSVHIQMDLAGVGQPASGDIRLRTDSPKLVHLPKSIPATQVDIEIPTTAVTVPQVVMIYASYKGHTGCTAFRLVPQ
ncbi:MAG TPA: GH25 family lysozyme [Fimbriimonadaceae bacterium]|jgi:GH25 family lysozyme M1 (1,4-beta-N-acetylmuramidase)